VVLCKAFRRVSIVFTSLCSFIFHYLQFVIISDTTLSCQLLSLRLHVTLKFYLFRFLVVLFCYRKRVCTMKSCRWILWEWNQCNLSVSRKFFLCFFVGLTSSPYSLEVWGAILAPDCTLWHTHTHTHRPGRTRLDEGSARITEVDSCSVNRKRLRRKKQIDTKFTCGCWARNDWLCFNSRIDAQV